MNVLPIRFPKRLTDKGKGTAQKGVVIKPALT